MIKNIARPIVQKFRRLSYMASLPAKRAALAPLSEFEFDIYSQSGEDGLLPELFRRLGITGGYVVEFGAWDGMVYSNTYNLIKTNPRFEAIYIEGDEERFKDLQRTAQKTGRITPICTFVQPTGEQSLDSILKKTPVPKEFELLSIDIDSFDYQVWQHFSGYKPKVVIIEVNSSVLLDVEQIHGENNKQGSSFTSTLALGHAKGYRCVHHRGNMIFVRNDLVGKLGHLPKERSLFRFKA